MILTLAHYVTSQCITTSPNQARGCIDMLSFLVHFIATITYKMSLGGDNETIPMQVYHVTCM